MSACLGGGGGGGVLKGGWGSNSYTMAVPQRAASFL